MFDVNPPNFSEEIVSRRKVLDSTARRGPLRFRGIAVQRNCGALPPKIQELSTGSTFARASLATRTSIDTEGAAPRQHAVLDRVLMGAFVFLWGTRWVAQAAMVVAALCTLAYYQGYCDGEKASSEEEKHSKVMRTRAASMMI